jgi:hypothetical protein
VVRGTSAAPRGGLLLQIETIKRGPDPLTQLASQGHVAATRDLLDELALGGGPSGARTELLELFALSAGGDASATQRLQVIGNTAQIDLVSTAQRLKGYSRPMRRAVRANDRRRPERMRELLADPQSLALVGTGVLSAAYRAEVAGRAGDRLPRLVAAAGNDAATRDRLAAGLAHILTDKDLAEWVEADPDRLARAKDIAILAAPIDQAEATGLNDAALAQLAAMSPADWVGFPNQLIVVPGYTPLDETNARPGVHPTARARLEQAAKDYREGEAPFVFLSGSNVYPEGTPYFEAIEMRNVLIHDFGVPADRIILDTQARHSTTNIRNAGRFMARHGMTRALITTNGAQDFYFSRPRLSGYHRRARRELGYEVGTLRDVWPRGAALPDRNHTTYSPSADVLRVHWRDPREP